MRKALITVIFTTLIVCKGIAAVEASVKEAPPKRISFELLKKGGSTLVGQKIVFKAYINLGPHEAPWFSAKPEDNLMSGNCYFLHIDYHKAKFKLKKERQEKLDEEYKGVEEPMASRLKSTAIQFGFVGADFPVEVTAILEKGDFNRGFIVLKNQEFIRILSIAEVSEE